MNEIEGTALTLVDAARTLFALHGYDGTSVRAITAAAGANLGAITYHFGSKRGLYDHVVHSVVSPLAERVEAAASQGPVRSRIGAIVRTYFDYIAENPDLPQLMMQELVLGGPPPAVVAGPMKRVHGALTRMLAEGQAAGVIRPGPTPVMGVFILSVPVHMGMLGRALHTHLSVNVQAPDVRAQVVAAAVEFVTAGLCDFEGGAR